MYSYNVTKFIELPYHAFKVTVAPNYYANSRYLTDLTWIFNKLNATGCVHVLNDLYDAIGEQAASSGSTDKTVFAAATQPIRNHTDLLRQFLEQHFRPLNYDARQLYSLMPAYVEHECVLNQKLASSNPVVREWQHNFTAIPIPYLETLGNAAQEMMDAQRRKSSAIDVDVVGGADAAEPPTLSAPAGTGSSSANRKAIGYDVITNLGGAGYFVASLSVDREEICVWDVTRCMKVRTLQGIAQPTQLCPVGDFGAAVLCRREIKVIDLDQGAFKVRLILYS